MPGLNIRYLGDTARLPYGTKSPQTVVRYAGGCVRKLLERGALSGLVVACNTASAHSLGPLRQLVDLPVYGVIEPSAHVAVQTTKSGRIGVLATEGTVQSGRYQEVIRKMRPDVWVEMKSAPLLVPLAEEGYQSGPVVDAVLTDHLSGFLGSGIDTLVLGCTHYPMLETAIDAWFRSQGQEVTIVDSACAVAEWVRDRLNPETTAGRGNLEIMVTDAAARFQKIAERFLGEPVALDCVNLTHGAPASG
jgi:glutamate racemase